MRSRSETEMPHNGLKMSMNYDVIFNSDRRCLLQKFMTLDRLSLHRSASVSQIKRKKEILSINCLGSNLISYVRAYNLG